MPQNKYQLYMEQFIKEVEAYATALGKHPSTVLQKAANLSGKTWAKWKDGGGCSVKIMDKIHDYIKDNPA